MGHIIHVAETPADVHYATLILAGLFLLFLICAAGRIYSHTRVKVLQNGMSICRAKPRVFQKWWLQAEYGESLVAGRWFRHMHVFVPWWAWPLELIHRLIFGYSRPKKVVSR